MEGVFGSRGYARVELVGIFLSVAITWKGSEGRGWSGWVEGGEAVSVGHFSWKSGKLEKRSKAAHHCGVDPAFVDPASSEGFRRAGMARMRTAGPGLRAGCIGG